MKHQRHYIYLYHRLTKTQTMFDILIGVSMNGSVYYKRLKAPDGYIYLASADSNVNWANFY